MINKEKIENTSAEGEACKPVKPHRTTGLWLFDALLYPFLTNFAVFGISVYATYLTNKGGMKNAAGKPLHGDIGQWFHSRGNSVVSAFKKMGMNHEQADMSKMVFFSFADGTAVAPMVKLVEDRREKISKFIDDKLGTTPEDEIAAYKAEPKQSWMSVIGGRLAVAAIVAPTAAFLSKAGLNEVMFSKPGQRFGEWVAKKPNLAKYFGKLDIKELGRVSAFEFFYTSVCTIGLYVTSRFIARSTGKKQGGEMKSILDDNTRDFSKEALAATDCQTTETPKVKASESLKKPRKEATRNTKFTDYAQPSSDMVQAL